MNFYTYQGGKEQFLLRFSRQQKNVTVSKYNQESESNTCVLPFKNVFTTIPLTNNSTVFVNSSTNESDAGTSVLIQTYDLIQKTYSFQLFSGDQAISFTLPNNDWAIEFYAKYTNDRIPQPLIVGEKNVYFMAKGERTYIPKSIIVGEMNVKRWENLYVPYYNIGQNTNLKLTSTDIAGISDIQKQ